MADSTVGKYAGKAVDAIRGAVNSPTTKRFKEAGRQFLTDPLNIEGTVRAVKNRKKGRQGRAGSRH